MTVSLPRSMALKIADYLENDVEQLQRSYWDHAHNRVTPRAMRSEVERVKKWIVQIRAAAEPKQFVSGDPT